MSFKKNVEDHLKHFAQSIGLGELALNENNACGLCFDDKMIVNIEYLEEDDCVVFVASIKQLYPHESKEAIYEKALLLNLQHHSMQGAYTALSNDKSELLLMKSMKASLDYGLFESNLEKFVNTLEGLINEFERVDENSSESPSSSSSSSDNNIPPKPPAGIMV
jgi:hypothetical protein